MRAEAVRALHRNKISPVPTTVSAAPTHAPGAGARPSRHHRSGNTRTGVTDDRMATMPTSPLRSAIMMKVMPAHANKAVERRDSENAQVDQLVRTRYGRAA